MNQSVRSITNNNTELIQNETSRSGIIIDMLSTLVENLKSFETKFDNTFEEFGMKIDVRITVLQKQIARVETTLKHRRRFVEIEGEQETDSYDTEYSNDLKTIGLPIENATDLTELNERLSETNFENIMVISIDDHILFGSNNIMNNFHRQFNALIKINGTSGQANGNKILPSDVYAIVTPTLMSEFTMTGKTGTKEVK